MANKTPFKVTSEGYQECAVCGKSKKIEDFYLYKDKTKGRVNKCKKCFTENIVNNKPETFTPQLKELGYPYVPKEWEDQIIRQRSKNISQSYKGQGVFGKYIVQMQKAMYVKFTYEQSDQAIEAYEKAGDHNIKLHTPESQGKKLIKSPDGTFMSETDINLGEELTQEDKQYLAVKWGTIFTVNEWVQLEKTFVGMKESFPIEDAGRENDLKMICKVLMKANQALDAGDFKSFKDLMGVYTSLMKSGKFTAAQNKENGDNQINSAAELVLRCEKEKGFIPKFCTDIPQDKVDLTLDNMKEFLRNLVIKDLGFGKSLENAIKKMEQEKAKRSKKNFDNLSEGEEEIGAKRRNIYAELQRRIEEETNSLDEADSDDFLQDFVKEEGDDIPFFGTDEEIEEQDGGEE